MHDIIVVGLGPVGATLANLLAAEGFDVLALDRDAAMFDKPRAIAIDQESLRVLQAIGVAQRMENRLGAYKPTEYHAADGSLLRSILPAPPPWPMAWPSYASFVQPELDAELRAVLAGRPTATVRLDTEVVALAQHADHATLTLRDGETLRATYVLACDGGASTLRRLLGVAVEDMEFDEPWIVVDTLLERDVTLPPTNVQYCDPVRPATFINGPGRLRRWEFSVAPGENLFEMAQEASVWRLLAPWVRPGDVTLWRVAPYRFHAVVAEEWRHGRVLLAGDAAHQTPPFMGQGLNQGLRDAANLAWKLAWVLRGQASEALLDSYTAERRPNVRAVIALTKELGLIIGERDPMRAAARNVRMQAEVAAGRGHIVRQDLLPPLTGGCLHHSPGAGAPGPQPWLADGTRLDDALGRGFRLLLRDAMPVPAAPALHLRTATLAALCERDGVLAAWLARHQATAVLLRPDGTVFGTAPDAAGLASLLAAAEAALR
jgi:3-(3-hydroxy-phenyl)propionate hydroxylase